MIAQMG